MTDWQLRPDHWETDMTDELKPCPFCSGPAERRKNPSSGAMTMVSCRQCGAEAFHLKWQRRADQPVSEREAAMVAFVLRCSAENPAAIGSAVGKAAALLERFGIEPRAPGVFFHTIEADENDARAAIFDAEVKTDG